MPKSAFWTAILKVRPLLISASVYQIVDGNSSVWSTPWFEGWQHIYDNLIIQPQPFNYPAQIRDLWIPGEKVWNVSLINKLFSPAIADSIIHTPIICTAGQDILVWKLTPTGIFSSKSAYKHSFANLQLPSRERPKTVPPQILALLNQVWKEKHMAPRIQIFAWRLLCNALATGKRAGTHSKYISENCATCGNIEDEMHLFFLCPFAKEAWYSFPWFIKTEFIAHQHNTVPQMIQTLLSFNHPQINVISLYTYLWCIWKSRNDNRFCRATRTPSHVFAAATAIMQGTSLEVAALSPNNNVVGSSESKKSVAAKTLSQRQDHLTIQSTICPGKTITNVSCFSGPVIYTDASWNPGTEGQPTVAGIGIFIQFAGDRQCSKLCISAISPPVTSVIQAEAFSMMLASRIAELLHLQQVTFLTDNMTLATALAANKPIITPGHWTIRSQLAYIAASSAFDATRVYHVNRNYNFRAHHQASLALKVQNSLPRFKCLDTNKSSCLNADVAELSTVLQCTVVHVRCC